MAALNKPSTILAKTIKATQFVKREESQSLVLKIDIAEIGALLVKVFFLRISNTVEFE